MPKELLNKDDFLRIVVDILHRQPEILIIVGSGGQITFSERPDTKPEDIPPYRSQGYWEETTPKMIFHIGKLGNQWWFWGRNNLGLIRILRLPDLALELHSISEIMTIYKELLNMRDDVLEDGTESEFGPGSGIVSDC